MKLPSAEKLAVSAIEPIWISLNVERIRALEKRVADAIHADRCDVLEAAAEVADKRESDVCRAIAAEIRALKENL